MVSIDSILNEVLLSTSVNDAIRRLQGAMGVDHVTCHLARNSAASLDNPFVRTTYPESWVSHYLLHNYVVHDPILKRAMTQDAPFFWCDLSLTPEEAKVMSAAEGFDLGRSGYSVPWQDQRGRRSILSVNSNISEDLWRTFIAKTAETWSKLAMDLHHKAIAEAMAESGALPKLSKREYECLKWSSEGKTNTEIAIILGISEHTTRDYLRNVRLKLDSISLAQAVAKASALGML